MLTTLDDINALSLMLFFVSTLLYTYFAITEVAFASINRQQLREQSKQGLFGMSLLEKWLTTPKKLQIGFHVGYLMSASLMTMGLGVYTSRLTPEWPWLFFLNGMITAGLITALILGISHGIVRLIPVKQRALLTRYLILPFIVFMVLLLPFRLGVIALRWALDQVGVGSEEDQRRILSEDEIKAIVNQAQKDGILEKEEKEMIDSIFYFSKTVVREIMTPRTDTFCISAHAFLQHAIELMVQRGHSRIPVYKDKIDNIVGIVYAKDLLQLSDKDASKEVSTHMREATFIPETQNIEDLLNEMRNGRIHLAIVIDEYGGMAGVVTLEDILEEIVGEIRDEYDHREQPSMRQLTPHSFIVDASMNIEDLGDKLHCKFPKSDDYDTIGGFVLTQLGHVPARGEQFPFEDYDIVVRDVAKRRIRQLEFRKKTDPTESQS
jgi:CBS domain containing-hemolysin-like protein